MNYLRELGWLESLLLCVPAVALLGWLVIDPSHSAIAFFWMLGAMAVISIARLIWWLLK